MWLGHRNRRGSWYELNSDDHDDEDWVCRWLCTSRGDVGGGYCEESNVWGHDTNGYWFHSADHQLRRRLHMGRYGNGIGLRSH